MASAPIDLTAAPAVSTTIDLTGSPPEPPPQSPAAVGGPSSSSACPLELASLPGGVLDPTILSRVDAIAQQSNCVGCDGRGLAEAIAKTLPYGCSYKQRRRMPPANKFAVPGDRAVPGTIDVRRPPATLFGAKQSPMVINMFAQWEMGVPGRYNRVQPSPPSDSARQRESWFAQCLQAISELRPKPRSIAFPHQIGCGLAGGNWDRYESMLMTFAQANPDVNVIVCRMSNTHGGGRSGGRGFNGFGNDAARGRGIVKHRRNL
ncbi:hypothetical protein AB1Y20_013012 [Prymnesium parvum]|uniref:Macro domain-containing protein n=1 Tax=Prymnesium parvum TaxID=97485 RepID=A0AB34IKF8_PRYPA